MLDLNPRFFLDALSIILIDILLAGDNAVVIAMQFGPCRRISAGLGSPSVPRLRSCFELG